MAAAAIFENRKITQNPNFGGMNRRFPAKLLKPKTCILSKLLHRFQPNFLHNDKDHQVPFVGGPNIHKTNPRWRTAAMLEKSKNCHILTTV